MTDACSEFRPFLAALADGETALLPEGIEEHIGGCEDCAAELAAHRLLSSKLRAALPAPLPVPMPRRRPWLAPAAAAAAVLAIAVGALVMTRPQPDLVATAVLVADRQPQYSSADPNRVARWCARQYGESLPAVDLAGMVPVGARVDDSGGGRIATVTYARGSYRVHVSWLGAPAGVEPAPAERDVEGRHAVTIRAGHELAVVTGDAPDSVLLSVARQLGG